MIDKKLLKKCAMKLNERHDLIKLHTAGLMWQTIEALLETYLQTNNTHNEGEEKTDSKEVVQAKPLD